MDGIDGITAGQTICTSLFTIILVWLHKLPKELDYYAYSVIGSCAGFLRHNWHPAKIFIGDVGATSIGYIIGWLLIVLACYDLTYAPLCILPYYIGDSTITLLSRICKGKKIWERHTDHYFSQAVRKQNMPHNTVVWYIVLINILVFIVYIAMYMSYVPLYWSCLFAFLAISLLFRKFSSNRYEEQNY
jgi:UDP-N-acetylmuramyl pentapeptide phosphotransferase/UDP-N-acetylglucosamine-1-phosphate transferase